MPKHTGKRTIKRIGSINWFHSFSNNTPLEPRHTIIKTEKVEAYQDEGLFKLISECCNVCFKKFGSRNLSKYKFFGIEKYKNIILSLYKNNLQSLQCFRTFSLLWNFNESFKNN